jgi:T3SS negative regulator,GrlR
MQFVPKNQLREVPMVDGLWIVQYVGLTGSDSGTVVLVNGKAMGGDNGWVYTGTYRETQSGISAQIDVHNFNPAIASVLNIKGDYSIQAELKYQSDDILQGNASLVKPEGVGIILKLTRYCGLD